MNRQSHSILAIFCLLGISLSSNAHASDMRTSVTVGPWLEMWVSGPGNLASGTVVNLPDYYSPVLPLDPRLTQDIVRDIGAFEWKSNMASVPLLNLGSRGFKRKLADATEVADPTINAYVSYTVDWGYPSPLLPGATFANPWTNLGTFAAGLGSWALSPTLAQVGTITHESGSLKISIVINYQMNLKGLQAGLYTDEVMLTFGTP